VAGFVPVTSGGTAVSLLTYFAVFPTAGLAGFFPLLAGGSFYVCAYVQGLPPFQSLLGRILMDDVSRCVRSNAFFLLTFHEAGEWSAPPRMWFCTLMTALYQLSPIREKR